MNRKHGEEPPQPPFTSDPRARAQPSQSNDGASKIAPNDEDAEAEAEAEAETETEAEPAAHKFSDTSTLSKSSSSSDDSTDVGDQDTTNNPKIIYAKASVIGSVHAETGTGNQDRVRVEVYSTFAVFGVFDGHGESGSEAAEVAMKVILDEIIYKVKEEEKRRRRRIKDLKMVGEGATTHEHRASDRESKDPLFVDDVDVEIPEKQSLQEESDHSEDEDEVAEAGGQDSSASDSSSSSDEEGMISGDAKFDAEDVIRRSFRVASQIIDALPLSSGSGTTATVALILFHDLAEPALEESETSRAETSHEPRAKNMYRGELYVGAVGDSQAIIGTKVDDTGSSARSPPQQPTSPRITKSNVPLPPRSPYHFYQPKFEATCLSPSHRVSNPVEKQRILECGGLIQGDYVVDRDDTFKVISVTRSLGDVDMQASGIISEPEISYRKLHAESDSFLILASDGLWDAHGHIHPKEVVNQIVNASSFMSDQPVPVTSSESAREICSSIIRLAGDFGPLDDCSIIFVCFL
mmetsp:Transcript_16337/g.28569  ORF Transcript_16337/g.28569 Transcript_16337/m.28569 type:complete len:522 (-) Transcript_16337:139-1704(-)